MSNLQKTPGINSSQLRGDNSGLHDYKDTNLNEAKKQENQKLQDAHAKDLKQESKPKATSVGYISGQLKVRDLMERFSEKISDATVLHSSSHSGKEMEAQIDQLFNKNGFASFDTASLSQASQQQDTKSTKAKSRTSDSLAWSEVLEEKTNKKAANSPEMSAAKASENQAQGLPNDIQNMGKETIKQYLIAYSGSLTSDSPQKKATANRLKDELLSLGFPEEKLVTAENNVQRLVALNAKEDLKQSYLKLLLNYTKEDSTGRMVSGFQFEQMKSLGKKLGVTDTSDSSMADIKAEVSEDIHGMISYESDQILIKNFLADTLPNIFKEFAALNPISLSSDFKALDYTAYFQKKINDLGLRPFFLPPNLQKKGVMDDKHVAQKQPSETLKSAFKAFAKSLSGNTDEQKKKSQSDQQDGADNAEDELENLALAHTHNIEDQIRSLYMQKHIKTSIKQQLQIHFKLVTLLKRNPLPPSRLAELEAEAKSIAKFKLTELLREAFEERATLPVLKGPPYQLVKDKFKTALSGLKKLGYRPLKRELNGLRDQVNKSMFPIIRDDYVKLELYIENMPKVSPDVKRQRQDYLTMLERLKAESNIIEDIRPKAFQDILLKSDTTVVDVA